MFHESMTNGSPNLSLQRMKDTNLEAKKNPRTNSGVSASATQEAFKHQLARVPTTSTSTRRFFARPARVALSATGWVKPLPSV
jgi:hypothetical protein